MICKTIRVTAPVSDENPLGYIVINESDLTDGHTLFDAPEKGAPESVSVPKRAK